MLLIIEKIWGQTLRSFKPDCNIPTSLECPVLFDIKSCRSVQCTYSVSVHISQQYLYKALTLSGSAGGCQVSLCSFTCSYCEKGARPGILAFCLHIMNSWNLDLATQASFSFTYKTQKKNQFIIRFCDFFFDQIFL